MRGPPWIAPALLGAASCGLLLDFGTPAAVEVGLDLCLNGFDDDLDGRADCEDPSCECNACDGGSWAPPPLEDELGTSCRRSCECRRHRWEDDEIPEWSLRVCNLSVVPETGGRCAQVSALGPDGEPSVDERAFWVSFLLERDETRNTDAASLMQNVVGLARFRGERFEFRRGHASPYGLGKVVFRSFGHEPEVALEVPIQDHHLRLPFSRLRVVDSLDPVVKRFGASQELQDPVEGFGFLGAGEDGPAKPIAVVQSSTLTLRREGVRFVRGEWHGLLRAPAAVDRLGRCGNALQHPEVPGCSRPRDARASYFAFGCVLSAAAPEGSGSAAYLFDDKVAWRWGECVGRRDARGVELRIRGGGFFSPYVLLRTFIRSGDLTERMALPLVPHDGESGLVVQGFRGATQGALFDLELGPPDFVFSSGRLSIEMLDLGASPRLFGWLEGIPE